ncbi:uncharacterized protein RCO7_11069 [Rhynchosporium graminicola]|uniref:Uncharacterized protein n=1 Tax=Rhynchosporium graminicola TaxID=2792576 RepID=A0A1E1KYB5_9HELO|nr:uncharacterized protein RCO7_11069 [Rhynchosporium commune]
MGAYFSNDLLLPPSRNIFLSNDSYIINYLLHRTSYKAFHFLLQRPSLYLPKLIHIASISAGNFTSTSNITSIKKKDRIRGLTNRIWLQQADTRNKLPSYTVEHSITYQFPLLASDNWLLSPLYTCSIDNYEAPTITMGSKIARVNRDSLSSIASRGRASSKSSEISNISPKTTAPKRGSGSLKVNFTPGKTSPLRDTSKVTNDTRVVQLPGLPFKSFMNGTLITSNGEPTVRPAMEPLPVAPKISKLSATTPNFVPTTPSPKPFHMAGHDPRQFGMMTPPTGAYDNVQNLTPDMRASSSGYGRYAAGNFDGHNGGYNGGYNDVCDGGAQQNHGQAHFSGAIGSYPTPPGFAGIVVPQYASSPGPSSVHSYDSVPNGPRNPGNYAVQPPRQVQTIAQRPTREFIARKDRSKKDIIVTADGLTRNHVRIIERQLPNGTPYQSFHYEFDAPEYNVAKLYEEMSVKQKEDFLAKNFLDIQVDIKSSGEEAESFVENTGGNTEVANVKKKRTHAGKAKNKAQAVMHAAKVQEETATSTAVEKREFTSLDVLKSLGPEIVTCSKRMAVTLVFPPSNKPIDPNAISSAGPVAQFSLTPPSGPSLTSPDFLYIKDLVDYIHTFKALTHLSIVLKIPASQRMPFTMPQLYHVLPFYDLGFTDWDIKYLPDNLSIPAKVQGWAVGQLDRERNKIIAERLRKVEEAVFVRGSVMPGISNDNLDAAAKDFNTAVAVAGAPQGPRHPRAARGSR